MFVISSRNFWLVMIPITLIILSGLACSSDSFIVTLTPTAEEGILIPTMTTKPEVVYPTLTYHPTNTPTALPDMVCDNQPVKIVCEATVCVVRNEPHSGKNNIAYTVPNKTVLEGAFVCICSTCAELEKTWFFLGQSGNEQFWAIQMDKVWEPINGE